MDNWLARLGGAGRRRASAGPAERKQSIAAALVAVGGGGRPRWSGRDYGTLAREGFARNAVAYRCVRMIAEGAASVPLRVFADGALAADHPLQRLLERPNPEQGRADLLEGFYGGLQTAGNGYLEAAVEEGGNRQSGSGNRERDDAEAASRFPLPACSITELYALRPDRMAVVPGARGWPEAYDYTVDGRTARLSRRADGFLPVLHLKLLNPTDDHYGFSPLEAAAFAVDAHNAGGAWNKALLDNAARPSGALIYSAADGRMSEEQFDRLKAQLTELHTGAAAAGRPLLLEGGLEWRPMSLSPAEMDWTGGRHAAAREIALAFGVPPQLLGVPGDNTYANYREANVAFWRQTVVPLVERTARALGGWLGPMFGRGLEVRADWDAVPALTSERDALWARLEAASFLTVDERRRMAGLG